MIFFDDDKQMSPVLAPFDKSQPAIMASKPVQSFYNLAKVGGHKLYELYVHHRIPAVLAKFLAEFLAEFVSRHVYDGILKSAAHVSTVRHAVTWIGVAHRLMSRKSSSLNIDIKAIRFDRLVRQLDSLLGATETGVIKIKIKIKILGSECQTSGTCAKRAKQASKKDNAAACLCNLNYLAFLRPAADRAVHILPWVVSRGPVSSSRLILARD
jgi:hypothetical protein